MIGSMSWKSANLGFIENAPILCIWDCKAFNAQPTGYQSFKLKIFDIKKF